MLFEIAGKGGGAERNLFLVIFNLALDVEKDVRHEMASFLTEMLRPAPGNRADPLSPQLDIMSPQRCLVEFANHIHRWFQPLHLIPVVLEVLAGPSNRGGAKKEEDQLLYESESHNFSREETECANFLIRVSQSLIQAHPESASQMQFVVHPILDDAGRILDSIEASTSPDSIGWAFNRPGDVQAAVIRLAARLQIVALCWPSWQTNVFFGQLQSRVQRLILPT